MHAVHAIVQVLHTLGMSAAEFPHNGGVHRTWAVFGGKNSKEKVGFPSAREWASFSEMCMLAARSKKEQEKEN
jgi:hypothetical protein